ncbi:hypothetical protein Gasu2_00260 [Galdieria sulphuraria]|uniref:ACT domain-containing protein n=1 Tax=Galdieria sulphuraria TaxID=130081 RepID=M2WS66_GALSU|nr:uncharacterized protein Gasu_56960 [Galdieria sulphuraria]EME26690.1 hypothetical protein Gasu_56960 [Galdieria sulphuraria]GJD05563.1 hypothetical protein Gasu2_00260 [Galdieria sulphuraria]|eukprot:XP_005703210.1 hypothetical protein Gasu_56960 [Galdieria sulphuraria]
MESSYNIAFEFGERDTWVIIKCKDRSGLLLDIIHTLVHFNLSIHSAVIETLQDGTIQDRFGIRRKEDGSKITHPDDLEPLRMALERVIGEKPIRIFWKHNVDIFQVLHIVCPERSHLLGDLVSFLESEQLLVKACEVVSSDSSDIWICFCNQNNQLIIDHNHIKHLIDGIMGVIEDPSKVVVLNRKHKVAQSLHSHHHEYGGRIVIDNSSGPFTTVAVNTDDRFGLLYDLVLALSRGGYSIISANITTREDIEKPESVKAYDIFEISDGSGEKVCNDFEELNQLRQSLMDACTHPALIDRRDNHIIVELCYSQQMKCIHGITQGLRNMGLAVQRAMIRSERIAFIHDKLYIRKDSTSEWDMEERKDIETKITETILSKLLGISIYEVEQTCQNGTIVV